MQQHDVLFNVLELPCGVVLKNRIAKSAMSDSLGDGTGHPTSEEKQAVSTVGGRWAGHINYWRGAGHVQLRGKTW